VPTDLQYLDSNGVDALQDGLSNVGKGAKSRQDAAERIVSYLYENFRDLKTGEPACALIRCFQTCSYAQLPLHYRDAADHLLEHIASHPKMRCLSLLATRGGRQVWNDVATSLGHLCIPLPSVDAVKRAPMISRLLQEIGVSIEQMVTLPDDAEFLVDRHRRVADSGGYAAAHLGDESGNDLNIFHVERAGDSPYIPAQDDFVKPYGVRSVIGMGGLLPDGNLFVVILFSRVDIRREVAKRFRELAPGIRKMLLSFGADRNFHSPNE